MPQVSNVISSSLNYKTSQKSGRVETYAEIAASQQYRRKKHNRMNSHSILQVLYGHKEKYERLRDPNVCSQ